MLLTISPFVAALLTVMVAAILGALVGLLVASLLGPTALGTYKKTLGVIAGIAVAVIIGLLVWLLVVSTVTFSSAPAVSGPAPFVPVAPALGSPALPAGSTSCTARLMTTAEATNLIDATSADEFADSLTVLFGRQVDTQCLGDITSPVGGWQVSGPAVILTDPGHMPITGARVVKTWNFQTDWIFGVYFCPAGTVCSVPTPGRAVYLDGNLPESYLH